MALDDLVTLGEAVRHATRTLAAAMGPGISPLTGQPIFAQPADEVYIGMGVHGEPGVRRRKVGPVRDLVGFMLDALMADRPIARGTPVVSIVNGTGGCTMMELLTVYRELGLALDALGIPYRAPLIGSFSITQEMAGFSIRVLTPIPQMLALWLAPHAAPQFPVLHGGGRDDAGRAVLSRLCR